MRFLTTEPFRGAPAGRVVLLDDDAIPSRFLVPLDERAVAALRRAKEAYLEDLEFRRSQLWKPLQVSPEEREDLLRVPPIPDVVPAPAFPEIDLRRGRQAPPRRRAADEA